MVDGAKQGMPEGVDLNEKPAETGSAGGNVGTTNTAGNVGADDAAAAATAAAAAEAAKSAAPEDGKGTSPSQGEGEPGAASPSAKPDDGGEWYDGLPDELREVAGKFDGPEALVRGYQNLETMSGTSIRIPGDDAGPEARTEFLTKLTKAAPELMVKPDMKGDNKTEVFRTLGMPETADGYTLPEVEGADAKVLNDELGPFRELAHKSGLTNPQYQDMAIAMISVNQHQNKAASDNFAKEVAVLKNEWGDAYGDRYRAAAEIAKRTGAPEGVQALFKDGTINTETIKWMYDLHKSFGGEGSELTLQEGGAKINDGPVEAKAQLDEIFDNKQHPYWNSGHPENQAAIKRVVQLQMQADPNLSSDTSMLRGGQIPGFALDRK